MAYETNGLYILRNFDAINSMIINIFVTIIDIK